MGAEVGKLEEELVEKPGFEYRFESDVVFDR